MSSAMKKNSITKKPFCKVCFDAGKDSAHPLRNVTGQTVCPYLLTLQCNNCRKSGHTVKYCTSPKRFNTSNRAPQPKQELPKKEEKPKQKSHFDVFQKLIAKEEDKERERECEDLARRLQEHAHKTNFPVISEKKVVAKKTSDRILTGWSKAVGKPVKVYETLSEEEEDLPVEKEVPQKKKQLEEEQEQQQQEQEDQEQRLKEDRMAEQDQAEQDQAEQDQAEQDQAEQDQAEPELNTYRPTYTSWADCE